MSDLFGNLPRFPLAYLPTPLTDAVNLRAALGGPGKCPRILIKRDDLTGLAYGGNKVRKLEFLIGDALAQGCTDVLTAGAEQSNHCRATAAACVVAGLRPTLVLDTDHPEQAPQGNLLLERMMGAHIDFVPKGADKVARMEELAAEITKSGGKPYVIPVGGSCPVGTVGYLTMAQELAGQLQALGETPRWLYFASGSRGTQAGIVLGMRLFEVPGEPRGICISLNNTEAQQRALANANIAAEIVGSDIRLTQADLVDDEDFVGEAYAVPTEAGDAAIDLVAKTQAIFLDPVYTGKGMSA
ncbi:MAG TPA: D-cysteine desulfhydrase family protein, partial [Thermomicrobiales bacterium]|nr:D-cysteine desulfhydrase family protein [Thermomicrobiales bacterium]